MLKQFRRAWRDRRWQRSKDQAQDGLRLIERGRYQAGLRRIQSAENAALALGQIKHAVELLVVAADILIAKEQFGPARWCADEAVLQAADGHDAISRVRALDVRGDVEYSSGDTEAAVSSWRLALEAAEQTTDQAQVLDAHEALGLGLQAAGEFDSAAEHFRQALELATALRDHRRETDELANLGYLAAARGDAHEARRLFQEVLPRYVAADDQLGVQLVSDELAALEAPRRPE